jgi:hypothetical protein
MRWLVYFCVIFLTLFCGVITAHSDDWRLESICDTGTGSTNGYPSLGLDSHDYPHFSFTYCDLYDEYPYYDDYNYQIKYGHWTGSSWEFQTIDGKKLQNPKEDRLPYLYLYSSLDVDSQDNPHVMYSDAYENDLTYAHWDGSNWKIDVVDEFAIFSPDIKLDSQDYPHCVYAKRYWKKSLEDIKKDFQYTGHYMYAYWTGTNWELSDLDQQEGFDTWGDIHLALDSLDQSYVVWRGCATHDLRYAKWDGTTWDFQIIDASGKVSYDLSMALDSQEHLHIVYNEKEGWQIYDLKYAYWTGSEWDIQTLDTSSGLPFRNSIAFDSQDRLHIAYVKDVETPPYYHLMYAFWTGSEWEIENICSRSNEILSLSFKLDPQDKPHILFHDYQGHKIYYVWQGEGLDISLLSFTATPQEDFSVLLNWQVECTEGEQIAGFNLYRREINNDIAAEVANLGCKWTKVNSSLITGQNPHSYSDCACPA